MAPSSDARLEMVRGLEAALDDFDVQDAARRWLAAADYHDEHSPDRLSHPIVRHLALVAHAALKGAKHDRPRLPAPNSTANTGDDPRSYKIPHHDKRVAALATGVERASVRRSKSLLGLLYDVVDSSQRERARAQGSARRVEPDASFLVDGHEAFLGRARDLYRRWRRAISEARDHRAYRALVDAHRRELFADVDWTTAKRRAAAVYAAVYEHQADRLAEHEAAIPSLAYPWAIAFDVLSNIKHAASGATAGSRAIFDPAAGFLPHVVIPSELRWG